MTNLKLDEKTNKLIEHNERRWDTITSELKELAKTEKNEEIRCKIRLIFIDDHFPKDYIKHYYETRDTFFETNHVTFVGSADIAFQHNGDPSNYLYRTESWLRDIKESSK